MPPFLSLLRPGNFLLSFSAVALGAVLAVGGAAFGTEHLPDLVLAMASAALVGSGANALNDALDVAIDRINRPHRPVSSGRMSPAAARRIWAVLSLVGVGLAALASALLGAVAAGSVVVLWVYNRWLKGTPGPGNVAVASVIATAPLFGALAVEALTPAVWTAVGLTFLVTLAREITKDVEDAVGDAAGGAGTMAVRWGERPAAWVAVVTIGVTLALVPVPTLWGVGRAFLAYVLGAAACLLTAAWSLSVGAGGRAAETRLAAARARAWLKAAMVAGVAALLLARLN